MALSGSTSVQCTPNVDLVFSWSAVQDKQAKTSTVSWVMKLVSNDVGRIDATSASPHTVVVDGQEYTGATNIGIETNSEKELASGQQVMSHNADGTRSFDYTFTQVCNITIDPTGEYVGTVSGSGTGELDAIVADPEDPDEPEDPDDPEVPDDSTIQNRKHMYVNFYLLGRCGNPYPFGGVSNV